MSTRNLRSQAAVDSAAWNVFARHRPYYHILSDPSMLEAGPEAQKAFWATGDRDVQELMTFAGLSHVGGLGVDFGCGLGRLTQALIPYTASQIGLDISTEMVEQARDLHTASPTLTFRAIEGVDWPIPSGTASLVISMLVFAHLSTADLVEHSLREIGRVLAGGGHAVFSIQTNTRRGVFVEWLRRIARVGRPRLDPKQEAIRQRLTSGRPTLDDVTTEEIVGEMMQMEFRRMKSFPLHRVASILRSSGLTMRKVLRHPASGSTLLAVDK
jgi:SAM-dependent methyltransferase